MPSVCGGVGLAGAGEDLHLRFAHRLGCQGPLRFRLKQMAAKHLSEEGPFLLPGHHMQNIKIGANNLRSLLSYV